MPFPLPMRLVAVIVLLAFIFPVSRAAGDPEDELKAAIVLSFLGYGEWPPLLPNAALTVGVLGRAAFAEALRRSLEGKAVGDHTIHIVELKSASEQHGCQIIYFATDKGLDTKTALQSPSFARVLTIGETRDFLDWGGAVDLYVLDGHMAFEVSLEALEHSGVGISSRLLRFGQIRNRKKGERS